MKILIDMSEAEYNEIEPFLNGKKIKGGFNLFRVLEIIKNGTPLPKGHGELKDARKIANKINALKASWNHFGDEYDGGRYDSYDIAADIIEDAPTIIEADTGE